MLRFLASVLTAAVAVAGRAETGGGVFTFVGNDVEPRFFHAASRLADGRVLASGGMTLQLFPPSLISLDAVGVFDPGTATFTTSFVPTGGGAAVIPVLAVPRSDHTQTTLVDGRVLFTGGRTAASGTNPGAPVASVELFDPVTGAITAGPPLDVPLTGHTATRLGDGRVVVAGESAWRLFVPAGVDGAVVDTWTTALPLARTRRDHAAVLLPETGRVLLVGGLGTGPDTLEVIDPDVPATMLLSATLPTGVDDVGAARLDDGRVLIVGGQELTTGDTVDDAGVLDVTADIYAPVAAPPNAPDGVADHALVNLGRFTVLFGGETQIAGTDTERDAAALFDRVTQTWTAATMLRPQDDFPAVVLADGGVLLIAGGAPFAGQELPSAQSERFDLDPARPADLDGDGSVGFSDLILVLSNWGPCAAGPCDADLDGNGGVGFEDLLKVLAVWGACS